MQLCIARLATVRAKVLLTCSGHRDAADGKTPGRRKCPKAAVFPTYCKLRLMSRAVLDVRCAKTAVVSTDGPLA